MAASKDVYYKRYKRPVIGVCAIVENNILVLFKV